MQNDNLKIGGSPLLKFPEPKPELPTFRPDHPSRRIRRAAYKEQVRREVSAQNCARRKYKLHHRCGKRLVAALMGRQKMDDLMLRIGIPHRAWV